MQAVSKMAQIKTETFTATSGADAKAKAAAWREAHPTIKIIAEHKPIAAAAARIYPTGQAEASCQAGFDLDRLPGLMLRH